MQGKLQFTRAGILILVILTGVPLVSAAGLFATEQHPVSADWSLAENPLNRRIPAMSNGEIIWSAYNAHNEMSIAAARYGAVIVTCSNGSVILHFAGIGRAGSPVLPVTSGTIQADAKRLDIVRPGYTEWYVSGTTGIEQGMTIMDPPNGSGTILVSYILTGDLKPVLAGQDITFTGKSETSIHYSGLSAWDAKGRILPASLALSGSTLSWQIDDTGARYPITIDPYIATEVAAFRSPNPLNNARYGWAVSVHDTTMLVGEDGATSGGLTYAGQAYIYQNTGGTWGYVTTLSDPVPSQGERFGNSVALDDDIAVIGAYLADPSGVSDAGQAYVYTQDNDNWNFTGYLNASDKSSGAKFGSAVAVSNSTIVVGTPSASLNGISMGQVYVFEYTGGAWTQTANITSPDQKNSVYFGGSVSLDNDTLVVGAYQATTGDPSTAPGRAYVYKKSGGVWSRTANLSAWTNQSVGARFGSSVAIDNDSIIVGAMYADPGVINAGQAYIFANTGGTWSGTAALVAPDASSSAYFASSVSLWNDTAVIGAYGADPSGISEAGQVYAYKNSGGSWTETARFNASDLSEGDNFGKAISLYGTTVAAGAPFAVAESVPFSGKAYVFNVGEPAPAPSVTGIIPSSWVNTSDVAITNLSGTGFNPVGTTTVRLTRPGYSNITTTATAESSTKITCTLPLTGAAAGTWSVVVINPDGQTGVGEDLFTVTSPSPTQSPTPGPAPYAGSSDQGSDAVTGGAATLVRIPAGSTGTFRFSTTCSATQPLAITQVQVIPLRTLGETTVTVARSSGSLAETRGLPVAGYEEIELVGINPDAVRQAIITFALTGSWLDEHNLEPGNIVMVRNHDGNWDELPTVFEDERNGIWYFSATTSGFSTFAATIRMPAPSPIPGQDPAKTGPSAGLPVPAGTITIPATMPETPDAGSGSPSGSSSLTAGNDDPPGPMEIPAMTIAIVLLCIAGIAVCGLIVRRWWRRRQNPALFRKYD